MEEFNESVVNATPNEAVVESQTEQVNPEQSVNEEVANPQQEEQVQSREENARFAEVRRKAEAEARDKTIADMGMEWNGQRITTYDQYARAKAESEEMARRESLQKQGIDPSVVDEYVNNNPIVKKAGEIITQQEQQERLQQEANEFFGMFPDVQVKDIDPKVYQLKAEKGLSLTDAYLRINFSSLKVKSEQEVIAKMQANSQSSPGSLSQGGEPPKTDIGHMNKTDFESLVARVKRGEKIQI